jgi:hypothetical protein
MKTIGIRILWKKYLLLLLLLGFIGVDIWEFYSILNGTNPDTLLWVMAFVVLGIIMLLATATSLCFLVGKNAISIEGNTLIVMKYKKRVLSFEDIENIQYAYSYGGGRNFNGVYKSGKIILTLKNKERISIRDIKNVKETCSNLKSIILKGE